MSGRKRQKSGAQQQTSPEDTLRSHSARVVGYQSDTSVKMLCFMNHKRKSHVLLALLLHDRSPLPPRFRVVSLCVTRNDPHRHHRSCLRRRQAALSVRRSRCGCGREALGGKYSLRLLGLPASPRSNRQAPTMLRAECGERGRLGSMSQPSWSPRSVETAPSPSGGPHVGASRPSL